MPKLRHIAIAAEDPYSTAEFYKQAFDFVEVRRTEPKGEGSTRGIHHFGVLVENVDEHCEKLEKLGATCFARRPPDVKTFYETKFHGPDKVVFDITDHPWKGAAPLPSAEEAEAETRILEGAQ